MIEAWRERRVVMVNHENELDFNNQLKKYKLLNSIFDKEYLKDIHYDKKNHYNITCNCKQCKNMYKHMQTEKACLQKYGVNNVFKLQQIKDKIYQTNLERYGVKNSAQSKEIMEKIL